MFSQSHNQGRSFPARLILFLFLFLSTIGASLPDGAAEVRSAPPAEAKKLPGAPVLIDKITLFYVPARVLSFSPEERAKLIEERINRLLKNPLLEVNSIVAADAETTSDVVAGDTVIMTVTDEDAKAAGQKRLLLAQEFAQIIRNTIDAKRREFSLKAIIFGAIFAFIATGVLILILVLMKKGFRKVYAKLVSWEGTRIRALRFQNLEILSAGRATIFLIRLAKFARFAIVIILFYFYIPLLLSFFPWTSGIAAAIYDYIFSPLRLIGQSVVSYLPKLFFLLIIFLITYYALKFIKFFFKALEKGTISFPGFYQEWAGPTYKIACFLAYAFAAVVAFPYLPGSDSPAFRGVSIFLGVLFSLGSTGVVANAVAGLSLTYTRAFNIGDRVKISDTTGDVIERTVLVTRIRTIKNEDITIPNALVLGSHIANYSSSSNRSGLILHTTVTIGYDAPWKKVHQLLIAAARETKDILEEPAPFVLQTSLDDSYVSYQLNAYTDKPGKMAVIYSDMHQNIQDRFNEAGVEIMSPHYTSLRDGNRTTTPAENLPKSYTPSAFRIFQVGDVIRKPDQKS
jgi:small-conductance mechanosensitive channel